MNINEDTSYVDEGTEHYVTANFEIKDWEE